VSAVTQRLSLMPWRPTLVSADGYERVDPGVAAVGLRNMTPSERGTTRKRGGCRALVHRIPGWRNVVTDVVRSGWPATSDSSVSNVAGIFVGRFAAPQNAEFLVVSVDILTPLLSSRSQAHFLYTDGYCYDISDGLTSDYAGGAFGQAVSYVIVGNELLIAQEDRSPISVRSDLSRRVESTIPAGSCVAYHKNRLYVAQGSLVFFSKAGAWRDFQPDDVGHGGGFYSVDDWRGEPVTAIAPSFYGKQLVFTRHSMSEPEVRSAGDFSVSTVFANIGCCSPHGVASTGNDLIFVSEKGVHSLATTQKFGDTEESFLSYPIRKLWARIDPKDLARCWVTYFARKGLVLITVPMSRGPMRAKVAEPDLVLVYHQQSQRWSTWEIPASCLAVAEEIHGFGEPHVIAGVRPDSAEVNTTVVTLDTRSNHDNWASPPAGADYAVYHDYMHAYPGVVTLPILDAGDPRVAKSWRSVSIYFTSGAAQLGTIRWHVDEKDHFGDLAGDEHDWERRGDERTFHLNPNSAAFLLVRRTDPGGIVLGDNPKNQSAYLAGIDNQLASQHLDIDGVGTTLSLQIEVPTYHPFDLAGLEVEYLVQNIQVAQQHRGGKTPNVDVINFEDSSKGVPDVVTPQLGGDEVGG